MNEFVNKAKYLFCLIKAQKYYNAVVLCEELMKSKDNATYYSVLLAKLFIIQEIEPDIFDVYCDELQHNDCFKDKDAYSEFAYIAGTLYYKNRLYDKSWSYLTHAVKNEKYRIYSLLCINHMETITEYTFKDKEKYVSKILSNSIDEPIRVFLEYYQMKDNKESFDKLNDYLWNECRKYTSFFYPEETMKNIIRDELFWIASKTNDKTRYYRFNLK